MFLKYLNVLRVFRFLHLFYFFLKLDFFNATTEIYIGNRSFSPGNGSLLNPYNNLIASFSKTILSPNETYYFILVSDFLTIVDIDIDSVKSNLTLYDSNRYSIFSSNDSQQITIIPLSCYQQQSDFSSCPQKTTISIKTERFFFSISGSFNLINIVLSGMDLPLLFNGLLDANCYLSSECCSISAYDDSALMSGRCYLRDKMTKRTSANFAYYSLFTIKSDNTFLGLYNTEINNFYAINQTKSYGFLLWNTLYNTKNVSIQFTNSSFNNTYFLFGFTRSYAVNISIISSYILNYNSFSVVEFGVHNQTMYFLFDVRNGAITIIGTQILKCICLFSIQNAFLRISASSIQQIYDLNVALSSNYIIFFASGGIIFIENTVFKDNSLQTYTSLRKCFFYLSSNTNFTISNSFFADSVLNNHNITTGFSNNSIQIINLTILNVSANLNTKSFCFLLFSNNLITVQDSVFSYLNFSNYGALFYLDSFNNLTMINTTISYLFPNNSIKSYGSICCYESSNTIQLNNSYITGISLSNGQGSLFYCSVTNSQLNIYNTSFTQLYGSGLGAIFFSQFKQVIFVSDCDFVNISLNSAVGIFYLSYQSSLTLVKTFFKNCTAAAGVIVFADVTSYFATFQDIMTRDTYASAYGGIFVIGAAKFILQNGIFVNSSSQELAGAMYFYKNVNISILENIYFLNMSSVSSAGGAIYFEVNSVAQITNMTIENAKAIAPFQPSGAVYILSNTSLVFTDCTFIGNYADNGGVMSMGTGNSVIFNQSFFLNCSSKTHGGVFNLNLNNILNLSSCYFLDAISLEGGSIYMTSFNFVDIDSVWFIKGNGMSGGVIYCTLNCSIIVSNTVFEHNNADNSGGDFYLTQNSVLEIVNSTFVNSTSQSSGGSFYLITNNSLTFQNVSFLNTFSKSFGGVFAVSTQNILLFSNISVANIYIDDESGFLDIQYNNIISIVRLTFYNFSVSASGFINALQKNSLNINNLSIMNGISLDGAGVFTLSFGNSLLLNNTFFENLKCLTKAGFMEMGSSNYMEMNFSEIRIVITTQMAGVLSLYTNNVIKMFQVNITNVTCQQLYGGVIWAKTSNIITLTYVVVDKITAEESGGLLYLRLFNLITISFVNFSQISAGASGGGLIYSLFSNIIYINDSFVADVFSLANGGVFNIQTTTKLYLKNVTFVGFGIYLGDYGGAILVWENNLIIFENCSFSQVVFNEGVYGVFAYVFEFNTISFNNVGINSTDFNNEDSNLLVSFQQNNLILVNFKINIGFCFGLFYISSGSVFDFVNFTLGANIEAKIVFQVLNSNLSIERLSINNKIHFNLVAGRESSILLTKFKIHPFVNSTLDFTDLPVYYPGIVSGRSLFQLDSCILVLNKGTLKVNNSVNVSGIQIVYGVLKMLKTSLISFITNEVTNAISATSLDLLIVRKSLFLLNRRLNGNGGVFEISFPENQATGNIKFSFSLCSFNKAQNNSGSLHISFENIDSNASLNFRKMRFQGNEAKNAGVAFFDSIPKTTVENCSFVQNRARNAQKKISLENYSSAKAGVFYFKNQPFADSQISFENNKYNNNSADIGGVFYHEGFKNFAIPNDVSFSILNSADFYGNFIASETQNIYFLNDIDPAISAYKVTSSRVYNIISGYTYYSCLGFIGGLDSYGQLTLMNDEKLNDSLVISNFVNEDFLNFTSRYNIICLSGPFLRNSLPIETTKNYQISYREKEKLFFQINYRSCLIGERLADNFSCIECLRGEHLFVSSSYCYMCGDGTNFYCFGGNRLTPKPGYWRRDTNTLNFLECHERNCLGDPRNFDDETVAYDDIYAQGLCVPGYIGVLCNQCQGGYGKIGDDLCEKCNNFNYFGVILFFTLSKVIFSLFCVHYIYNMGLDLFTEDKLSRYRKKNVVISIMLKIWVDHIDTIAAILFFPINWSSFFKDFLKYLFLFSLKVGDTLPLECLINTLGYTGQIIYFKLLLAAIYPFVIMFINLIYVIALSAFKRNNSDKRFMLFYVMTKKAYIEMLPAVVLSVLLLCYSDIMKVCLEMVQFINIGDSNNADYRLVSDGNVVFGSPDYNYWFYRLDFPLLAFYGVLFPVAIYTFLFFKYQKKRIYEPLMLFKYSFFFYSFKKELIFWEIIVILRKALLVFIQLYSFSSTGYRDLYPMTAMMSVLLMAAGVQKYYRPYQLQYDDLNDIEFLSLISLATTFYFGIYYSLPVLNGTVIPFYYHYIFIILGGCANLLFLIKIVQIILKFLHEKETDSIKDESIKIDHSFSTEFKNNSLIKLKVGELIPQMEESDHSGSMRNRKSLMGFDVLSSQKPHQSFPTVMEERPKVKSPSYFPPVMKPLTVIDEKISQEKLHRTYINLKGTTENISKKFDKLTLHKVFEWGRNYRQSDEIIKKSQEMHEEIKKIEGRLIPDARMETVYEFFKDLSNQENAQFDYPAYNYIFLEENKKFYEACLNNDQTFIESSLFKIKASYSLIGDLDSLIFVKLLLCFQTDLVISQFEFDIKRNEGKF